MGESTHASSREVADPLAPVREQAASMSDDELLDAVFDCAVERAREGSSLDGDAVAALRPALRDALEETLRLAEGVLVRRTPRVPRLRGYEIEREIGRGAMGIVYLAKQRALGGRRVALKVITGSTLLSDRARSRFLAEARALARVRHPAIVSVFDVVEELDVCAYAMEWVDGTSLARAIDARRAGGAAPFGDSLVGFVCRTGIALARALDAVHRAGLVHRDVKPSNVLLRSDGTALLSDFGLVRDRESSMHTQSGAFVGTSAYASPEQLLGESERLDARSDVFSLGVALFETLTGELPHGTGSPLIVLERIRRGPARSLRRLLPGAPRDLETILAKATESEPQRRYASAAEFADDLERFLRFQPIHAKPAGWWTRAAKLARRNRFAVAAGFGGVVAATAATLAAASWLEARREVPRLVAHYRKEAMLALLSPEQGERAFELVVYAESELQREPLLTEATAREASAALDAAYALDPGDATLAAERAAVRAAAAVAARWNHQASRFDARPRSADEAAALATLERDPRTAATASAVRRTLAAETPTLPAADVDIASPLDRRLLGLLTYLCGDIGRSCKIWAPLDLAAEPDAFVDGVLGELQLARGDAAKAYPRLLNAARGFPEAGFLVTDLADAATRVGDDERAESFVRQARTLSRHDRYGSIDRVEIDLAAHRARTAQEADAVERRYAEFLRTRLVPTAVDHYASFLRARGKAEESLDVLGRLATSKMLERHARVWLAATAAWWTSLTPGGRAAVLRRAVERDAPAWFIDLRAWFGPGRAPGLAAPARSARSAIRRAAASGEWPIAELILLSSMEPAALARLGALRADEKEAFAWACLTPWRALAAPAFAAE